MIGPTFSVPELWANIDYSKYDDDYKHHRSRGIIPDHYYDLCHYDLVGQEGTVVHRVDITKDRSHILRLIDSTESYIRSHLHGEIVHIGESYCPIWTDGTKVAKVFYTKKNKEGFDNHISMSRILDQTDIPHPKIYDYKVIDKHQAVIIMEYVGPSVAQLFPEQNFDSVNFVPSSQISNPELKRWSEVIEQYVETIEALGIDTQDNHEGNFCIKHNRLYVIDFEFWIK